MKSIIITTSKNIYNNNFEENNLIKGTLTKVEQITGELSSLTSLKGKINKLNDCLKGQIFKPSSIEGVVVIQDALIGQLNSIFKIEGTIEVSSNQETNNNYDFYLGSVEVTPSFVEQQLNTKNKILKNNIKVYQIKTYEVSNDSGVTFII